MVITANCYEYYEDTQRMAVIQATILALADKNIDMYSIYISLLQAAYGRVDGKDKFTFFRQSDGVQVRSEFNTYYFCVRNNELVGVAKIVKSDDERPDWISYVDVDRNHQAQGVATELMEAIRLDYDTLGISSYTSQGDMYLKPLYERLFSN